MKTKVVFTILLPVIFSLPAFSQDMPQAQKNIMKFQGKWSSNDIKINMGGQTYSGDYTFDCVPVNGNTGIQAHEKFVNKDLGTMLAENLLGYDPNLGQVHLYTIDNMGTTHDHYGYWIDDNHLFLQYQGVVDGKMYVEQLDMVFQGPNKLVFKLNAMLNGETFEQAKGTFVK